MNHQPHVPDANPSSWGSTARIDRGVQPSSLTKWLVAAIFIALFGIAGLFVFVKILSDNLPKPAPQAEAHRARESATDRKASEPPRTPLQIIARMYMAYESCATYTDNGVRHTVFRGDDERSAELTFATYFDRRGGFRLDQTERVSSTPQGSDVQPEIRVVIWGDHRTARRWWSNSRGSVAPASLKIALGDAATVSGWASMTVVNRLLPTLEPNPLADFVPESWADDSIKDHECYRVGGTSGGEERTLWIDRETFVLRRIQAIHHDADGTIVEEITDYDPAINSVVPQPAFEFVPPK